MTHGEASGRCKMACQSAEPLPWAHRPADPQAPSDWAEQALYMDQITQAFGQLYPFVPLGRTSVFLLAGRKP